MRQWARCARRGVLVPGPAPAQSLRQALPTLRLPVLPIAIEGDAFATPESIRALLAGLAPAPTLRSVGTGPGEQPLDHFRWLRAPDGVVREVAAFAHAVVHGSPLAPD
jgi:predicted alpha/beta hydrolase